MENLLPSDEGEFLWECIPPSQAYVHTAAASLHNG